MAHGEPSREDKREIRLPASPGRGGIVVVAVTILSPLPWLNRLVPAIVPRLGSPWATIYRPSPGLGWN